MTANSQKRPDYSKWPTKEQAAATLQVSTKSVEAFANAGKLQTIRWKRPSGGPQISVYHPADVEALRKERFPGEPSTFVMPAPGTVTELRHPPAEKAANEEEERWLAWLNRVFPSSQKLLESSEKKRRKPEVPLANRVFLTVREASAYAGLPERHLRQLIADGTLYANKHGHTRVRRRDLDQL